MKTTKTAYWALGLLLGSCFLPGRVWASYGVDEATTEWVNRASKIVPAKVDTAFGDNLSLYDGSVEFNNVDLSLPGIGPAVEVRRSFPVRDTNVQQETGIPQGSGERKELGDWSLDLPQLSGVFDSGVGWQVEGSAPLARCSSKSRPVALGMFPTDVYWSGNELHVPGQVSELLLQNYATTRPSPSVGTYPWTTKSGWVISCSAATANGYAGEGFIATSPDGTRYYLDWVVQRPYPSLTGPQYMSALSGGYSISRTARYKIYFLASKVIDRFGNQVNYNYTGNLLTSITASDGRTITLSYNADNTLATVSGGTQSYSYAYSGGYLQTVTRPDASKWTYVRTGSPFFEPESGMVLQNQTACQPLQNGGSDFTYDVTNPAGLKGSFKFTAIIHIKKNVPEYCKSWQYGKVGNITTVKYWQIPLGTPSFSLTQKDISGIGVPQATWTYNYTSKFMGVGGKGFQADCVANPTVCPLSKTVLVTGPNRFERYTFGIWWGVNDGQLLKKEVGPSADNILSTEDYTYTSADEAAQQPFGNQAGTLDHQYLDHLSSYNRPLKTLTKTQQGATFQSSTLAYDVFARPTSVSLASSLNAGRTESHSYLDDLAKWVVGLPLQTTCMAPTDCAGMVMSQTDYNANDLPSAEYAFGKKSRSLTYNADGTVSTVQDGAGHTTTLSNWKRGLPQTVTYPATPDQPTSVSTSAVVDNNGWVTSITDANGYKTCYAYDAMGRVNMITYPSETQAGVCDASMWAPTTITLAGGYAAAYGVPAGQWRQTTLTGNARHVLVLDALFRPIVDQTLDLGNVSATMSETIKRYDIDGNLTFQSYPMNTNGQAIYTDTTLKGTTSSYDALGRVTQVSQDSELDAALGHPLTTTNEYLNGFQTRVTSPRGGQTTTSYMAWDEPTTDFPTSIVAPESSVTEIIRDAYGKPLALTRHDTNNTVWLRRYFAYDQYQQLCKQTELESGSTFLHYDAAGNLDWSAAGLAWSPGTKCSDDSAAAYASGRRVDRTYDARNRLLSISFPDGAGSQAWSYTPDGKPAQVTTYNSASNGSPVTNSYAYTHRRLLTSETVSQPNWYTWLIGYGYDANGSLLRIVNPDGETIDYAPNALGMPTKAVSTYANYATGVSYYPNGAIKQFTYGNGIVHTLTQNARQLPDRSQDIFSGVAVHDDGYDYDANGNVAAITDGVGTHTGNRTMTYDGLDRLTDVTSPLYGAAGAHYTYDALDNLAHVNVGGNGARDQYYCYDGAWRLTNLKTGGCATGATVSGLDYDVQGNLNHKDGRTYTFDFGNRLRSVLYAGSVLDSYRYDSYGRRVMAWSQTLGNILSDYGQDGVLRYQSNQRGARTDSSYIYLGGSLLATREFPPGGPSTIKYQHTDALGSPVAVTDVNGTVLQRNDYEPYGKLISGLVKDGPQYTGHVADAATGLDYMQQRYYDPSVGRFLSVDPVTAGNGNLRQFNRYAYAYNNPYKFTDPDGRRGELYWTGTNQVTYTVRWTMTGVPTSNFTPDTVNAQIAQDFSGSATVNGVNVTVTAQGIYEATPGAQPLNTVHVVPDTAGVTQSGRSETNAIGGSQVTVGAGGEQAATAVTMSHELGGHTGGAGDQYAGGRAANGQVLSADVPGPANVMKDLQGQPANDQTRQEIVNAPTNTNMCAPSVTAANGGC